MNFSQVYKPHPIKGYSLDLCFTSLDFNEIENCDNFENLFPVERHHDPAMFKFKIGTTV